MSPEQLLLLKVHVAQSILLPGKQRASDRAPFSSVRVTDPRLSWRFRELPLRAFLAGATSAFETLRPSSNAAERRQIPPR